MLSKLFKHEVKAISRFAWPMLGGIILACILVGISFGTMSHIDNTGASAVTGISSVLLIFGIIIAQVVFEVLILVRFYTNLMTDEGYLSFTLPVTATEHICAKLLSVILFTVLLILADLIGLFLGISLGYITSGAPIDGLINAFGQGISAVFKLIERFFATMTLDSLSVVLLMILNLVFGFLFDIFKAYYALSIAGLCRKLKFLAGIGVYFGIQYAMNILNTVIGVSVLNVQISLIIRAALFLVGTVVLFFLTKGMLTKRLNLN